MVLEHRPLEILHRVRLAVEVDTSVNRPEMGKPCWASPPWCSSSRGRCRSTVLPVSGNVRLPLPGTGQRTGSGVARCAGVGGRVWRRAVAVATVGARVALAGTNQALERARRCSPPFDVPERAVRPRFDVHVCGYALHDVHRM